MIMKTFSGGAAGISVALPVPLQSAGTG